MRFVTLLVSGLIGVTVVPVATAASPAPVTNPTAKTRTERLASPDCSITSRWSRQQPAQGPQVIVVHAAVSCTTPQSQLATVIVVLDSATPFDLQFQPAGGGYGAVNATTAWDTVTFPTSLAGHDYGIEVLTMIDPPSGVPVTVGGDAPGCRTGTSFATVYCESGYDVQGTSTWWYTRPIRTAPTTAVAGLTTSAGASCRLSVTAKPTALAKMTVTGRLGSTCPLTASGSQVEIYADPTRDDLLASGPDRLPAAESSAVVTAVPGGPPVFAVYYVRLTLQDGSSWSSLPPGCGYGSHRTVVRCQVLLPVKRAA